MSDPIDASDEEARTETVPAGGQGADSGAVDAVRVDEETEAEVPNTSSLNDIPGVGTRGGRSER